MVSIRGLHTCLVSMLRQDHRQLDKHVITQTIQPIVKTNPIVSIKTLIAEIKTFMNYIPSYKKTWLEKQRALEMIHGNWKESYAKLPKLLGVLQSSVPETVVVYDGGEIVPKECLNVSFGHLVHALKALHIYIGTLLIATAQDGANHIFSITYAIVEGETTSAWNILLGKLTFLISDRHPSIISAYNNPTNLWVQDTFYFFCLRHIAQNFLHGNSNCKHLKKSLMLASYAYTEKMHWQHLEDICANKPSATE
ncbi:hypothetical protein HKD37_09G025830 [Glycine soja]